MTFPRALAQRQREALHSAIAAARAAIEYTQRDVRAIQSPNHVNLTDAEYRELYDELETARRAICRALDVTQT